MSCRSWSLHWCKVQNAPSTRSRCGECHRFSQWSSESTSECVDTFHFLVFCHFSDFLRNQKLIVLFCNVFVLLLMIIKISLLGHYLLRSEYNNLIHPTPELPQDVFELCLSMLPPFSFIPLDARSGCCSLVPRSCMRRLRSHTTSSCCCQGRRLYGPRRVRCLKRCGLSAR